MYPSNHHEAGAPLCPRALQDDTITLAARLMQIQGCAQAALSVKSVAHSELADRGRGSMTAASGC